jgi:hypothetical protein
MSAHHISLYVSVKQGMSATASPARNTERSMMSGASTDHHDDAGRYEIRLQGHLAARWSTWFDGLTLTNKPDGTTVISGTVADQAALHGLLQKARDVGLPLLSVTSVDADSSTYPPSTLDSCSLKSN